MFADNSGTLIQIKYHEGRMTVKWAQTPPSCFESDTIQTTCEAILNSLWSFSVSLVILFLLIVVFVFCLFVLVLLSLLTELFDCQTRKITTHFTERL